MSGEPIVSPLLNNRHIYIDENTTENLMRRISVREMIEMAAKPDPEDRNLLFEELNRAKPNEDVLEALCNGDPSRIKRKDKAGHLALHIACNHIHSMESDILMFLMERDPEAIKTSSKYGFLPLHKAVSANLCHKRPPNMDNFALIMEAYPTAVKKRTSKNQYPLHLAISEPSRRLSSDLVEMLINTFPKAVQRQDCYGHLPLHHSCRKTGPEEQIIFEALIEAYPEGASVPDVRGMLPLHHACSLPAPVLEVVYELIDAFPQGVLHRDKTHDESIEGDHGGRYPMDIVLTKGDDRCGTTMELLNSTYEKLKGIKRKVFKKKQEAVEYDEREGVQIVSRVPTLDEVEEEEKNAAVADTEKKGEPREKDLMKSLLGYTAPDSVTKTDTLDSYDDAGSHVSVQAYAEEIKR